MQPLQKATKVSPVLTSQVEVEYMSTFSHGKMHLDGSLRFQLYDAALRFGELIQCIDCLSSLYQMSLSHGKQLLINEKTLNLKLYETSYVIISLYKSSNSYKITKLKVQNAIHHEKYRDITCLQVWASNNFPVAFKLTIHNIKEVFWIICLISECVAIIDMKFEPKRKTTWDYRRLQVWTKTQNFHWH